MSQTAMNAPPETVGYGADAWHVTATDEGRVVRLHHPEHGWLAFTLPQDEAVGLAEALRYLLIDTD